MEVLKDYVQHIYKVRRLHLIVVDLCRPWRYNAKSAKRITDQLWYVRDGRATKRMAPLMPPGDDAPLRCRRYVYGGYALDNSVSMLLGLAGARLGPWLPCS